MTDRHCLARYTLDTGSIPGVGTAYLSGRCKTAAKYLCCGQGQGLSPSIGDDVGDFRPRQGTPPAGRGQQMGRESVRSGEALLRRWGGLCPRPTTKSVYGGTGPCHKGTVKVV